MKVLKVYGLKNENNNNKKVTLYDIMGVGILMPSKCIRLFRHLIKYLLSKGQKEQNQISTCKDKKYRRSAI